MAQNSDDPNEATLAAYQAHAERYTDRTTTARSPLVDDLLAVTSTGDTVLELGSGPGRDASDLEAAGLIVDRTDGAPAFVDALRRAGHDARVLNFYADDFGGPYDAIYANAVLLHAERSRLSSVLEVALRATRPGGTLAASFKMGENDAWSNQKLDAPRHFTYWQQHELRAELVQSGWMPIRIAESTTPQSAERWINVVARRPGGHATY